MLVFLAYLITLFGDRSLLSLHIQPGSHAFMLHFTYMHLLLWSMTSSYIPNYLSISALFISSPPTVYTLRNFTILHLLPYDVRGQPIIDFWVTSYALAIGAGISRQSIGTCSLAAHLS